MFRMQEKSAYRSQEHGSLRYTNYSYIQKIQNTGLCLLELKLFSSKKGLFKEFEFQSASIKVPY